MFPFLKSIFVIAGVLSCLLPFTISAHPGLKEFSSRSYKDSISKDSNSFISSKKYDELLEQIKGLESEIESEKSIREGFEKQLKNASDLALTNSRNISVLSEKVRGVEESADSDTNFWSATDRCGGVIISQAGQITTSATSSYHRYISPSSLSSPCIWTIRVNYRSKIRVEISGNSLTAMNTIVTEFILQDDGTHETKQTIISQNQKHVFNGPVILISTPSRYAAGKITFEGHGKLVQQDTEFRHYYYTSTKGSFDKRLNESYGTSLSTSSTTPKRIFSTVVINTEKSNLAELEVISQPSCKNSILRIQKGLDSLEQTNISCCLNNCPYNRQYSLDGWFAATYSSLVSQSNDSLKMNWTSRWNDTDSNSINKCGGVLMGKGGKISYKKGINYLNNERCVWVIYPFPKSQIKITHGTGGLESTYDRLIMGAIDVEGDARTIDILSSHHLRTGVEYKGRVFLITFYTDSSIVRQGFELTWEAIGPSDNSRSLGNEEIIHANQIKTNKSLKIKRKTEGSNGFLLYVFNNHDLDSSALNMTLTIPSQIVRHISSFPCGNSSLGVFGSRAGHPFLQDISWHNPCEITGIRKLSLLSPDGLGYILWKDEGLKTDLELDVEWQYVPPVDVEKSDDGAKCGGTIHGASGRLSYKVEQFYDNNERCIWTIHSPTSSKIELKLLKDGFEPCCDYLIVNTINSATATINKGSTLLTRENNTRVFDGPILILSFRSDGSVTGKGFVVQFTGRATLSNHSYTYTAIHRNEPESFYNLTAVDESGNDEDAWDFGWEEITEKNNIMILTYSSGVEPGDSTTSMNFNVSVEKVILGLDSNCYSDRLNFYTSPSREGFFLSESYPKMECSKDSDGTCSECLEAEIAANDTRPHGFSSTFRAFVAIYKSVNQENANRSFEIHWESASGCGGVVEEYSGRISYKQGSRYKNSELCIWTVYSSTASKIRFNLQSNGFEACCDYIILNSLNPKDGTLSGSTVLQSGNTSGTVDGPLVFVTFRSDASVTGEGFSLNFVPASHLNDSETLPYSYYNFHGRRRNSSFQLPNVGLGEREIVTYAFSPEPGKNESFLRYGTKINVGELQLKFNNETCDSDILRLYSTAGMRQGYNITRSYALDTPQTSVDQVQSSCHDSAEDRTWVCQECYPNQTHTQQLSLSTYYPGFIAVYKSSTNEERTGGGGVILRLEWNDLQRDGDSSSGSTTTTSRSN